MVVMPKRKIQGGDKPELAFVQQADELRLYSVAPVLKVCSLRSGSHAHC